jgi:hypothetical protein
MHVGDLDGSATLVSPKIWTATVTVFVHDQYNHVLPNAVVIGLWNHGKESSSCRTDNAGRCEISKSNIKTGTASVDFRVTDLREAMHPYHPGSNHDPDGDSNGTTIKVARP